MTTRTCGPCTVCCTQTRVPELNKSERVRCSNCESGCTIYDIRPMSCRQFECAWLKGQMPDEMRPDLSGVMVEDYDRFMFAMADSDEWMTHKSVLDKYVMDGKPVVIGTLNGNHMILPDGFTPHRVAQMVREAL